jgi:predicted Mrr-cat superfamily restriction endonuclease
MGRAWAIKLGSGGVCIPFCETRSIVGVGWKEVDIQIAKSGNKEELRKNVRGTSYYKDNESAVGRACGSLYRFCVECKVGDYILYYDPTRKRVRIAQVASEAKKRILDPDDETDIWIYREVTYPLAIESGIPIVSFDGTLKGSLLGPRGTFWSMPFERVDLIAQGKRPNFKGATIEDMEETQSKLWELIKVRSSILNESDWETLAADYFRELGAHIGKVGGSQAVQDFEAVFCKGSQLEQKWRVQVKRYQDRVASWSEIQNFIDKVDNENTNLCFVSVFGFSPEALQKADIKDGPVIKLLTLEDFYHFILSGKYNPSLAEKMGIST